MTEIFKICPYVDTHFDSGTELIVVISYNICAVMLDCEHYHVCKSSFQRIILCLNGIELGLKIGDLKALGLDHFSQPSDGQLRVGKCALEVRRHSGDGCNNKSNLAVDEHFLSGRS